MGRRGIRWLSQSLNEIRQLALESGIWPNDLKRFVHLLRASISHLSDDVDSTEHNGLLYRSNQMINVRFTVTSSETILSVITIFTLIAIICEMACWSERTQCDQGTAGVGCCSLQAGQSTKFKV